MNEQTKCIKNNMRYEFNFTADENDEAMETVIVGLSVIKDEDIAISTDSKDMGEAMFAYLKTIYPEITMEMKQQLTPEEILENIKKKKK